MLSIVRRYKWQHFGVLTSSIAGHGDFVQALRDAADEGQGLVLQGAFVAREGEEEGQWDLSELAASEVRIVLLYCTQAEAGPIMREAARMGLTSPQFMWLAAQAWKHNFPGFFKIKSSIHLNFLKVFF